MASLRSNALALVWPLLLLLLCPAAGRAATFLFDATKAETVANADWVIDEDNHVAARYPTPAASGITATTAETYWTGGLSSWGVALVQLGHNVETLPVGGRITYLDATNAQDLSNYQVYVVCEPNILFTASEKTAIARYVQDGGSLFVISDHTGSDRNNDGYDSVAIWNDFFNTNGVQANPFGVTINASNISVVSSAVDPALDDPLTAGPIGAVSVLKYSNGATMTINPAVNPTVRAAFWSGTPTANSNVMMAYGSFGAGRFAVIGDSSPIDDGTGSPGHTLYYGWTEEGVNHSRLILNASVWLAAARNGNVPYNDAFANATHLDPGATVAGGTNIGASRETNEPAHAGNAGGASVWYQFTPANAGTATISTAGSDFDTLLAVYTGTSVDALTPVAANDNADAAHVTSAVAFPVAAGTTYRVAVDGAGGATGHIVLALSLPGPANDLFANATTIPTSSAPVTITSNNFNATSETGEPNHAGYVGGRSVWWHWTAATTGTVTVSTVGSDFDTLLAVYYGVSVNGLSTIAANANYGSLLQSQLTFNASAGITYDIAVDGYAGAAGNILLSLSTTVGTPPVNDNFANAAALSGASVKATATTTYATKETGEPNHDGISGGHSVWWRWNAPGAGSVVITTVGSGFDTTLGIYTGEAVNALTALAGDDDSGGNSTSKVSLNVAADTTYYIAVDGYGSAAGSAVLNLAYSTAPLAPPVNDSFANAAALSGTAASATGTNVNATLETGETALYFGGCTVWWRWTAPADLVATVSTAGSNFDTTLGIYTGTAVNALTLVGSNDDFTGTTSQVSFNARSGVTYSIGVDGYNAKTGTVALALTTTTLPTVSLAATTPQAAEKGPVSGVFTLTLSAASAAATAVQVNLGGTATPNADYTASPVFASASGALVTVAAGQTSATLIITPYADSDPTEGNETVVATLAAGIGYQIDPNAAPAVVTIRDDSPYGGAWETVYRTAGFTGALAAPDLDFDGDGISNLMEFALNLNPLAADPPGSLPVIGTGVFVDPADANGATRRFATLTFTRRTDAPNLTYTVETTADPASGAWSADGAVFVSASAAGMAANTEQAVYRAAKPMDGPNAAPQQFLRLRVTVAAQ